MYRSNIGKKFLSEENSELLLEKRITYFFKAAFQQEHVSPQCALLLKGHTCWYLKNNTVLHGFLHLSTSSHQQF